MGGGLASSSVFHAAFECSSNAVTMTSLPWNPTGNQFFDSVSAAESGMRVEMEARTKSGTGGDQRCDGLTSNVLEVNLGGLI